MAQALLPVDESEMQYPLTRAVVGWLRLAARPELRPHLGDASLLAETLVGAWSRPLEVIQAQRCAPTSRTKP